MPPTDITKIFTERKYACTVVNLIPRELFEEKPHMLPATFKVPAAPSGGISVFHVEEGIHYVPNPIIDEGKPGSSFKITTSAEEMARSICEDYVTAQIALDEGAQPGIFWVRGRLGVKEVMEIHKDKVEEYRVKQKAWFLNLVAMADADWRKNHNMLAVSDLQRMAARELNINKEWVDFNPEIPVMCPACQTALKPEAVVCFNCKFIVKPEEFKKMQFATSPV